MPPSNCDPDIPEKFQGDYIFAGFINESDGVSGYMTTRGVHFTDEELGQPTSGNRRMSIEIKSVLRGISEQAVSLINVVLDNSHERDVTSREAMHRLLTFSAVPYAQHAVRRALLEQVPEVVVRHFRSAKFLPMVEGIFKRYACESDDPDAFTNDVNEMTKKMDIDRLVTTLIIFHVIMRVDQQRIIQEITGNN